MPMQMSPLNAGYAGVTRRVAIQAIKRIIPQLDLRPDTVIYTKGLEDNMMTWNSEKNMIKLKWNLKKRLWMKGSHEMSTWSVIYHLSSMILY